MNAPRSEQRPLEGIRVALTRAAHRSEILADRITDLGGRPLKLPVIEIAACPNPLAARALLAQIPNIRIAIFTSVPAVEQTFKLSPPGQWPEGMITIAVGPATRHALILQGVKDALCPDQFNSDGVLVMPELLDCEGKKILIPGAPGGRQLLHQELTRRGATVLSPTVYRRALAVDSSLDLQQALTEPAPLVITATSVAVVENLIQLAGSFADRLLNLPLLVASSRIAEAARDLGASQVHLAKGADDASMMVGIREVAAQLT